MAIKEVPLYVQRVQREAQQLVDGAPRRIRHECLTMAELAIKGAMYAVEAVGGSLHLTDAIMHLDAARNALANHLEGVPHESEINEDVTA